MMHLLRSLAFMLAGAVGALACTAFEQPSVGESEVKLSLAISVGVHGEASTRMTDQIVQNTGDVHFRGIEDMIIIPFQTNGPIQGGDRRILRTLSLPQQGLPANTFAGDAQDGAFPGLVWYNNSHLYKNVYVPLGTRSMLIYGKAIDENVSVDPDSIAFKSRNGSLRSHGFDQSATAGEIGFNLEPITDGTALETELEGLLAYLNTIEQSSASYQDGVCSWSDYARRGIQDDLASAYDSFVSGGRLFAGSSLALGQLLTELYRRVYPLLSGNDAPAAIAQAICSNISDDTYVSVTGSGTSATVSLRSDFPARYGVPSGAVTLQWNGTSFWHPTRAAGSQAVTLSSFCYPPSLWYHTNSLLVVSDDSSLASEYNQSRRTWEDITGLYSSSSLVTGSVRSVAVRKPLQYGVALLNVNLKKVETLTLTDSRSNVVSVANTHFPMTGMIVSQQRNLSYGFTPVGDEIFNVYDKEVYSGTTPKNYLTGLASGAPHETLQILMVQTLPGEDVHVALEFRNDSGKDFYGHDGDRILAGSHFYLFGTLRLADAQDNEENPQECIFLQDHITRVTFFVNSLAEAYSTIPELSDPQLSVGVQADLEWILSTPVTVPVK